MKPTMIHQVLLIHQAFTQVNMTKAVLAIMAFGVFNSHAATYSIDPAHANVRFAIDHFNTSTNTGGFYNLTGEIDYDATAKIGKVAVIIPINTLSTGNQAFDIILKALTFSMFKSILPRISNLPNGTSLTVVSHLK